MRFRNKAGDEVRVLFRATDQILDCSGSVDIQDRREEFPPYGFHLFRLSQFGGILSEYG
jgi:hypothetical protein